MRSEYVVKSINNKLFEQRTNLLIAEIVKTDPFWGFIIIFPRRIRTKHSETPPPYTAQQFTNNYSYTRELHWDKKFSPSHSSCPNAIPVVIVVVPILSDLSEILDAWTAEQSKSTRNCNCDRHVHEITIMNA